MSSLLSFLEEERKSVEYSIESLRSCHITSQRTKRTASVHTTDVREPLLANSWCLIHDSAQHTTEDCRAYLAKAVTDRIQLVKEKRVCFRCLKPGHGVFKCKKGYCGKDGCQRKHHPSIYFQQPEKPREVKQNGAVFKPGGCMLMAIAVKARNGPKLNTIFDSGATASIITHEAARRVGAKGDHVEIKLTKVGGEENVVETKLYDILLKDRSGDIVKVKAYGMESITSDLRVQDVKRLGGLLKVDWRTVDRPVGRVELLIGLDYANLQPQKIKVVGNLMLSTSPFGKCVGGWHPVCESESLAAIHLTQVDTLYNQFLTIESIGVRCNPKCGGCKCGKCPLGAKEFTLQEERELSLIEDGLTYQNGRWIARYPWVKNPNELPDNRNVALAKLHSLEKRLSKDPEKAKLYNEQIQDMIGREVAKEVSDTELHEYRGPVHYIAHHAVPKPDSESTPLRIVLIAVRTTEVTH
ncbi:uncharacterized protein LOC117101699 [Anneissia japonica]|uniref:uncharacterized protein LOC117101699 n=1 Tax=Anneissia japonica TaxID=1529436 RepID=UPI0014255A71|nr:uncharacterized protein LOC117101699 [Anneissia japonica]